MWARGRSGGAGGGRMKGFPLGRAKCEAPTSQGADGRLAVGQPCQELRGLSGWANPGVQRRGPGCALGGNASREGREVPAKWERLQEHGCHPGGTHMGVSVIRGLRTLEALTSTAALSQGVRGEPRGPWEGMAISRHLA